VGLQFDIGRKSSQSLHHYPSQQLSRTQKPPDSGKRQMGVARKLAIAFTPLLFLLSSCSVSQNRWNTYQNPRYQFEFPYPSNWETLTMPSNLDGEAFRDPDNPSVEIRGWAQLPDTESSSSNSTSTDSPNFTTEQGVTGQLRVEVGVDTSLMSLTLNQGQVEYHWQGQADSEQFADYYRFFNYIASQYQLPSSNE